MTLHSHLVKSQVQENPLDLQKLFLAPAPHYLGNSDGFFVRTKQASMFHFLMKDNIKEVKDPVESIFIQDGNGLFHSLVGLAPTLLAWHSRQILNQMAQK